MNGRQEKFVEAYVRLGNASKAVLEAGYNLKNENAMSSAVNRLLKNAEIQEAVKRRKNELKEIAEAKTIDVIKELARIIKNEVDEEVVCFARGEWHVYKKPPSHKDRIKACELYGKATGVFNEQPTQAKDTSIVEQTCQALNGRIVEGLSEEEGENDE